MYLNAGVSASGAGADDSTFIMYRLPLDYPDGANPHTVPNTPPVVKFYEEKTLGITDAAGLAARRDAHGLAVSANARYLYQFDRIQNKAEVFDLGKIINDPAVTLEEQAIAHAGTIDLTGSGHCVGEEAPFVNQDGAGYQFNDDPAPDHAEVTPDGRMNSRRLPGINTGHSETRRPGQLPWVRTGDALGRRGVNRQADPRVPNLPA